MKNYSPFIVLVVWLYFILSNIQIIIFNEMSDVGDAQLPHSEEKSDTKS